MLIPTSARYLTEQYLIDFLLKTYSKSEWNDRLYHFNVLLEMELSKAILEKNMVNLRYLYTIDKSGLVVLQIKFSDKLKNYEFKVKLNVIVESRELKLNMLDI